MEGPLKKLRELCKSRYKTPYQSLGTCTILKVTQHAAWLSNESKYSKLKNDYRNTTDIIRLTEVCGKVLSGKSVYKYVKTVKVCNNDKVANLGEVWTRFALKVC